jgi:hypothetical protein
MNCEHQGRGWCTRCVSKLDNENQALIAERAILLAACKALLAGYDGGGVAVEDIAVAEAVIARAEGK